MTKRVKESKPFSMYPRSALPPKNPFTPFALKQRALMSEQIYHECMQYNR